MFNITFHNKLTIPIAILYKCTDKLTSIVKGNFISFLEFCQKICVMGFPPWHGIAGKNGIINGIADTRMIAAIQISKIKNLCIFIPKNIHIIFQQDAFIGKCSCFIHTKHIHATKALHGINILDNGLLFAHSKTSFGKAGCNNHRKHFRHQTYSN